MNIRNLKLFCFFATRRYFPIKYITFCVCFTLTLSKATASEYSHVYIPFEERQSESFEDSIGIDLNSSDWPRINHDASSNTIEAALTTYTLGMGSLLENIEIDGRDIVRQPLKLKIKVEGKSINLPGGNSKLVSESERHISFKSTQRLRSASITTDMHFADDGFLLVNVKVSPMDGKQVEIQNLSLEIPMANLPEYYLSRHATYDFRKQRFDKNSFFDSIQELKSNPVSFEYNPVVSIESQLYGIEWMSETNAWHSLTDPSKAVIIEPKEHGLDFNINFVTKPLEVSSTVNYQFSLFPIPSRKPSESRHSKFFASAGSARKFKNTYSKFKSIKPIYFANWSRMKFSHPGLPMLSGLSNHQEEINFELDALLSNGLGYMPYTSMHLLASSIPEMKENLLEWRADESRRSSWRGITGERLTAQPVAFSDPSLTEFMLNEHLVALKQTDIDIIYHDVAAMNRLKYTQERAIGKFGFPKGTVYAPFFGQRDYLRRYRNIMKSASPSTDIAFHTGAMLPRSIATYSDYLVFGEPFHHLFKENAERYNTDYIPNYFSLPSTILDGPYKQKNGFTYVLIPQLKRAVDNISPDKKTLDKQTRALLTFSAYHGFPVWGTKLSTREFVNYQRMLDKFLLNGSKEITLKFFDPENSDKSNNLYGVYIYDNLRSMFMLSNESDRDYILQSAVDLLPEDVRAQVVQQFGGNTVIKSKDSIILMAD